MGKVVTRVQGPKKVAMKDVEMVQVVVTNVETILETLLIINVAMVHPMVTIEMVVEGVTKVAMVEVVKGPTGGLIYAAVQEAGMVIYLEVKRVMKVILKMEVKAVYLKACDFEVNIFDCHQYFKSYHPIFIYIYDVRTRILNISRMRRRFPRRFPSWKGKGVLF